MLTSLNNTCAQTHTLISSTAQSQRVCLDTGCTDTLLRASDATALPRTTTSRPLHVGLPNGTTITSIGSGQLTLPNLHQPISAHIFPDKSLSTSLLSISDLCSAGCEAHFTATSATITKDGHKVLHSTKHPTDKLWNASVEPSHPPPTRSTTAAAMALSSDREFVQFAHAALGSPTISTLRRALQNQYLTTFPRLTAALLSRHPPHSTATAQGHLDQTRQGMDSTTAPAQLPCAHDDTDTEDDPPSSTTLPTNPGHRSYTAHTKLIRATTAMFADLTGRFPTTSSSGMQYILISLQDGYIHAEAMASRHHKDYIQAFQRTITFFQDRGRPTHLLHLDNETSAPLTTHLRKHGIELQYVPPHQHRANRAERAIRTFKNHFIATLSTASPSFPLHLWDRLLPQTEICLNHLRPFAPNPKISAYAGLQGGPFNFKAHPIAPLGTKVLIHDKPSARASWAPHGTPGFYLGPALQHYRCFITWATATSSTRVTDTVAWLPERFHMPTASPTDLVLASLADLRHSLQQLSRHRPPGYPALTESLRASLLELTAMYDQPRHPPTTTPTSPGPQLHSPAELTAELAPTTPEQRVAETTQEQRVVPSTQEQRVVESTQEQRVAQSPAQALQQSDEAAVPAPIAVPPTVLANAPHHRTTLLHYLYQWHPPPRKVALSPAHTNPAPTSDHQPAATPAWQLLPLPPHTNRPPR